MTIDDCDHLGGGIRMPRDACRLELEAEGGRADDEAVAGADRHGVQRAHQHGTGNWTLLVGIFVVGCAHGAERHGAALDGQRRDLGVGLAHVLRSQ